MTREEYTVSQREFRPVGGPSNRPHDHYSSHQTIPFLISFTIFTMDSTSKTTYNKYLASIIDPLNHTAWYPDLDMTTAWLKTVTLTNNLKVLADGEGLFVYTPASHGDVLRLYTPRNPAVGYVFTQTIPLDQPLSENYTWGRPVSAGIRFQDATISTTSFTLNGTFNAVGYQELPDLSTMSFVGVMAQARSDNEKLGAVPCSDGIVATLHPGSQNPFKVFETNAVRNVENILSLPFDNYDRNNLPFDPTLTLMSTLSLANGDFPFGIRGRLKGRFTMTSPVAPVGALGFITITFSSARNDPLTWGPAADETHLKTLFVEGDNTVSADFDFELESELTMIQITRSALTTIDASAQLSLTFDNNEFYSYGFRGPGTLVAFQGLVPNVAPVAGSVIAIAGVQNMELVPNAELAKNITTNNSRTEKPFELDLAELMIANGEIKFLHNYQEYRVRVQQDFATRIASEPNVAKASGFSDFLKGVVKTFGPVVGAVNPLLGMGISALGNAFSAGTYQQPANASGSYTATGTYHQPSIPQRRRLNAATDADLLEELKGSTVNSVDLPGSDVPELLEDVRNILSTLRPTFDGIPMEKNLKDEAFKRGVVTSLARYLSINKFPLMFSSPETGGLLGGFGYVVHSPVVVFPGQTVRIGGPAETQYDIYSNIILESDVLLQIGCAHLASGSVTGQVIIYVDPKLSKGVSSMAGMSLGLAVLTSLLGRESFSALTGAVDPNGNIYAPAQLKEKWDLCVKNNVSLICPYDEVACQPLLDEAASTGRSQYVSMPAENQYGDFTSSGFWPEVVLAANVTVVQLAAQNSRYWCLKAQRPSILGQPVPSFTMDMIERTDKEGQEFSVIAPIKRHADYYMVGRNQVEKSVVDPAVAFIMSPGIIDALAPLVRLGSIFVGRKFFYPSGLDAALKKLDPVAVMGAISVMEQYRQWQENKKKVTNMGNDRVMTYNEALPIIQNAPVSKLIEFLNVKSVPDSYSLLNGEPGTLDDYVSDLVDEKILKGEITGIAAQLSATKKRAPVYSLAYLAQPARSVKNRPTSAQVSQKAPPKPIPPKVQLAEQTAPTVAKRQLSEQQGVSLFSQPQSQESLIQGIIDYGGEEVEPPPGFSEQPEAPPTAPQLTGQDAINQQLMQMMSAIQSQLADVKKGQRGGFSRNK